MTPTKTLPREQLFRFTSLPSHGSKTDGVKRGMRGTRISRGPAWRSHTKHKSGRWGATSGNGGQRETNLKREEDLTLVGVADHVYRLSSDWSRKVGVFVPS